MTKLFSITDNVYSAYKKGVRGNSDTTYDMARRKLTRNILMADDITPKRFSSGYKVYQYGQLRMYVSGGQIHWLKNNCLTGKKFIKDKQLYDELNIKLGIVRSNKMGAKYKVINWLRRFTLRLVPNKI